MNGVANDGNNQRDINSLLESMKATPVGNPKREKRDRVDSDGFYDLANDEHLSESKLQ